MTRDEELDIEASMSRQEAEQDAEIERLRQLSDKWQRRFAEKSEEVDRLTKVCESLWDIGKRLETSEEQLNKENAKLRQLLTEAQEALQALTAQFTITNETEDKPWRHPFWNVNIRLDDATTEAVLKARATLAKLQEDSQ